MKSTLNCSFTLLILILLLGFISTSCNNNLLSANPLSLVRESTGSLLPAFDIGLQMVYANVVMEIDETYGENQTFKIVFDGNYTIYNPNDTCDLIIGAPFQTTFAGFADTLRIDAGGYETDFYLAGPSYPDSPFYFNWESYLEDFSTVFVERNFAICNITFSGYSNTSIRYRFESITSFSNNAGMVIAYDVSTASAWDGVTTEFVEFRVFGKQPYFYYNNTQLGHCNLTLTEIDGGRSYLWSWIKAKMEDQDVWISYYPPSDPTETSNFRILSSLGCLIMVTFLMTSRRNRWKGDSNKSRKL